MKKIFAIVSMVVFLGSVSAPAFATYGEKPTKAQTECPKKKDCPNQKDCPKEKQCCQKECPKK